MKFVQIIFLPGYKHQMKEGRKLTQKPKKKKIHQFDIILYIQELNEHWGRLLMSHKK